MSGLPPAAVNAGASAAAGTSSASDAAAASTASSPAQTNISLPNGPAIDSATRTNGRKRPREEEDTPELATDATASETATPSNTPPSVHDPAAMQFRPPGICASATDNADNGMVRGNKIAASSDDGTDDEIDQAMEETVLPALPPEEHLFRHMVDSRERLGCVAQPNPREYLYWKITDVVAGSQAQDLGILVGHYIISVDGQRLVNGTSLTEVFQRAVSVGKPFEVVTSDFPVRAAAAAAGRGQQQLLGNSDSGTEESSGNSTPEQCLDDTERELPVSPEIRRAMTVANSPASKSPYHAFDRVSQSIVPGSTGAISLEFGIFRTELRKLIKQCTKRLCIFPQDGRPWLDYALNLVFASLWYNAPDRALGWNVATDEHRRRGLGVRAELKGPQPWMATRAFIVECIKNMLEAENNDWVTSSARKVALKKHHEPRINQYLKSWNSDLSKAGHSQLLQAYSDHVWTDFEAKYMAKNGGVGALHKLSERWIIQSACEFSSSDIASAAPPSSPDPAILGRIRAIVDGKSCSCASNGVRLCKCKKLPLELYPFAKDRELVATAVLNRFQENSKVVRMGDVTKESVRTILDDLEDETGFVTKLNGLFSVTVAAASKLSSDLGDKDKSTSDDELDLEPHLKSTVEDRGMSIHSSTEQGAQSPPVTEKGVSFSSDSDDALSNVGTGGDSSPEMGLDRCDEDVGQQQQSTMTSADATRRQYSTTKAVGSRVYARFTAGDDEYYWGTVKAKREGFLTVVFDDGSQYDVVDDDSCIVTEKEYACLFSTPPSPPKKRMRRETASTDLCGRGYCHPYTDKEGNKRVVYGVVSRRLDGEAYTIQFDKDCISSINRPTVRIKPTQDIASDLVIAGCIAHDRITKASNRIEKLSRKTPLRYLVVPEMRKEEQVEYNGIQVSKLSIVLRAHQLVFSVKKSTIGDNATLGVFVKCTSLLDNTSAFRSNTKFLGSVLKKGELLDLGVFNHSDCFKHVNRCGPKDVPSIHPILDPEGGKHYYFGVRYHGDYQRYKSECSRLDLTVNEDEEVELFLFDAAASRK